MRQSEAIRHCPQNLYLHLDCVAKNVIFSNNFNKCGPMSVTFGRALEIP